MAAQVFTLPTPHPLRPPPLDTSDVAGADIAVRDGYVIGAHGDWMLVERAAAAEQSVRRELTANTGALARRPDWGVGAVDSMFRSATRSELESLKSKARARTAANPRVARVVNVATQRLPGVGGGTLLSVEYNPVGVPTPRTVLIGPRRPT